MARQLDSNGEADSASPPALPAPPANWPPRMEPRRVPVWARNEILVRATPEAIWSYLARARQWPDWYPYASRVTIADAEELSLGVQFDWHTFDVGVHSQVVEWQPYHRLAWDAKAILTRTYHRWTIEPQPYGLTRVVTEESQRGPLPALLRFYLRRRLSRQHRTWLENLKCLSEAFGAQPSTPEWRALPDPADDLRVGPYAPGHLTHEQGRGAAPP